MGGLTAATAGVAAVDGAEPQSAVPAVVSFSERSDQELNALLATQWDTLADAERRALLTEVKLRMARHKGRDRAISLQTQRRYGRRIIRQRDGSVVRIETQVVRVRPAPNGQRPFGVGFEERSRKGPEATAPPVMTVNDPAP